MTAAARNELPPALRGLIGLVIVVAAVLLLIWGAAALANAFG